MTDQEINTAIAEWVGWTYLDEPDILTGKFFHRKWFNPKGEHTTIPDFCHDLNAMYEAFLKLDFDSQVAFVATLLGIQHGVDSDYFNKINWADSPQLVNATAPQRAEALLRTIGQWKD